MIMKERSIELAVYWHTSAHILAQAVKRLFPSTKLWVGPAIENGFYYDFDTETPLTAGDLPAIEFEMQKIIDEDYRLQRFTLERGEAVKFAQARSEPYKAELINELPDGEEVAFYQQEEFVDLCAGPHLPSVG